MDDVVNLQLALDRWMEEWDNKGVLPPNKLVLFQSTEMWRDAHALYGVSGQWDKMYRSVCAWIRYVKETDEMLAQVLERVTNVDGKQNFVFSSCQPHIAVLDILGVESTTLNTKERVKEAKEITERTVCFLKRRKEEIETNNKFLFPATTTSLEASFWSPGPVFWAEQHTFMRCCLSANRNGEMTIRRWPGNTHQLPNGTVREFVEHCDLPGSYPSTVLLCSPERGLLLDAGIWWRVGGENIPIADAYDRNLIERPRGISFSYKGNNGISTIQAIGIDRCQKGLTLIELAEAVKIAWGSDPEADWRLRILTEKSLAAIAATISGTQQ